MARRALLLPRWGGEEANVVSRATDRTAFRCDGTNHVSTNHVAGQPRIDPPPSTKRTVSTVRGRHIFRHSQLDRLRSIDTQAVLQA